MRPVRYTRTSFFVARAIERVAEMEKFWRFMAETRGSLKPGSIEAS